MPATASPLDLAEPAWQRAEVAKPRSLNRAGGLALLAREANFAAHDRARERGRRDDKDEMLKRLRLQRLFDLAPPVAPALERDDVLPDGEIALLKPRAQPGGELRAVLARIGDEGPAR